MKILFTVTHPKHIYIFRNIILKLIEKGVGYKVLAVDKDIVIYLLDTFNIEYELIGKNKKGIVNKLLEMPKRMITAFIKTRRYSPTVILGQAEPEFAIIGKLLSIPTVFLPDSEGAFLSIYISFPLASHIIVSDSYSYNLKQKHIRLNHYLELAYLNPKYFFESDNVYDLLNIEEDEKYMIIRFVSWNAYHDIGHQGISLDNKIKAVEQFSGLVKVFISSENELPQSLEKYRLSIKPENVHEVMAKASLFFGESATMATESAVLGTPAIYIDNNGTGYTKDIEKKYGLVFNYTESLEDQEKAIFKGVDILKTNYKDKLKKNKARLLNEKVDITEYLLQFLKKFKENTH